MKYVDFQTKLFRAGVYPDRDLAYGVSDLDTIINNSRSLGQIPVNFQHAPTQLVLDSGYVDSTTLHRVGDWIMGTLSIPEPLVKLLKARGLSVMLDTANMLMTEVTITDMPRVAGASFSGETPDLVAFSSAEEFSDMPNYHDAPEEAVQPVEATEEQTSEEQASEEAATDLEASEPVDLEAPDDLEQLEERITEEHQPHEPEAIETFSDEPTEPTELDQLRAQLAARDAELARLRDEKTKADVAAFATRSVAAGVPPKIVDLLAPFAVRSDVACFSETEVGFAKVADEVVKHLRGTVPFSGQMPTDDERVPFIDPDSPEFGESIIAFAKEKATNRQEYEQLLREEYDRRKKSAA